MARSSPLCRIHVDKLPRGFTDLLHQLGRCGVHVGGLCIGGD